MKVTLIHNPDAGDDAPPSAAQLLAMMRSAGHIATYRSSKENDWENALGAPGDLIAVAGGDGMVGKVAKRLIGRRLPIAILPMGTANNIARTLGLMDRSIEQLIGEWNTGRRVDFDVGVANGAWGSTSFIEGLGVGLFTETMYRLDARDNIDLAHASDTDEKIISVLEILQERLQRFPARHLDVTLDGHDLSGEYILLEVMNVQFIGPNLYLAPNADPADGMLDIMCVSRAEHETLNRYLSACIAGKAGSPPLTVRRGRRLRLGSQELAIRIDDEVWPGASSTLPCAASAVDVNLQPAALHFLVPG